MSHGQCIIGLISSAKTTLVRSSPSKKGGGTDWCEKTTINLFFSNFPEKEGFDSKLSILFYFTMLTCIVWIYRGKLQTYCLGYTRTVPRVVSSIYYWNTIFLLLPPHLPSYPLTTWLDSFLLWIDGIPSLYSH